MRLTTVRVGVAAAVVVVLAIGGAGWWWTHPHVIGSEGNGVWVADPQPLSPTTAVQHVGMVLNPVGDDTDEVIVVDEVRPVFAENTAGATARALVCTRRKLDQGSLTVGPGGTAEDLEETCTKVVPFTPGLRLRVESGEPQERYLVWRIEAVRPGTWRLEGADIDYRRTWHHLGQRGTVHSPDDVRFTFT